MTKFFYIIFFVLLFEIIAAVGDLDGTTLVHSQIFFRHGHRAPRKSWPTDTYRELFDGHFGELTSHGFLAAYGVGQKIRQWYSPLLHGPVADRVYMRSTQSNRTFITAHAVLLGLLNLTPPPEIGFFGATLIMNTTSSKFGHLLPKVNTVPLEDDHLLKRSAVCPKYERVQEVVSAKWKKQLESKNLMILQSIYNLTQVTNETKPASLVDLPRGALLKSAWTLFDGLYSWKLHNMSIPSEFDSVLLQKRLRQLAALKMRLYFCDEELLRIRSTDMRRELLSNIAAAKQSGKNRPKSAASAASAPPVSDTKNYAISLYSTHDSTLTMLLCVLKLYSCQVQSAPHLEQLPTAVIPPEYAAAVMIDLYLEKNSLSASRQNYTVGIWYYNPNVAGSERIRLKLPGCSERCPVEEFERVLHSYAGEPKAVTACRDNQSSSNFFAGFFFKIALLVVFVFAKR